MLNRSTHDGRKQRYSREPVNVNRSRRSVRRALAPTRYNEHRNRLSKVLGNRNIVKLLVCGRICNRKRKDLRWRQLRFLAAIEGGSRRTARIDNDHRLRRSTATAHDDNRSRLSLIQILGRSLQQHTVGCATIVDTREALRYTMLFFLSR